MRARGIALGSQAARVLTLLREWPDLQTTLPSCRAGVGVAVGNNEILHLHAGDDAELCLTRPTIYRLYPALAGTNCVILGRSEDWIGIRLGTALDTDLLLSLLSVAIKTCVCGECDQTITPCSAAAFSEDPWPARQPAGIVPV
ncbi:luciferase family protein [Nonomuraea typhae]|uniref:luciferase domain-containing protein n=1 Tax=Nonomuraea typhae TaxID=2603600 RepID=UPI0012FA8E58|nr:luciferase family protein [Nonomuraea typhae]